MKEKRKLKSWQVGLVACIITAILFFIMLTITNNNPLFGGLSYAGDLPDQYLSFFQYWRHLLLGNLSGFSYSFSNGLGGNMLGNISYYLMSPLNFIILLFPGSKINIAVYLIIWIKLSLASFTFSWVISKFFKFQYQSYAVFLGVAYGLSAYCMIYFANLMWLDSVILLPLIIYFLQKLLIGKSPVLYILLLALDLIFNYYTAYMVCIFVVITFIAYTIIYFDGWKKWCKQAFNFAISSILSGMISGFVLLPTFLNLRANKLTQTEINQNFHLDSIATIKSVSSKLFIGDLSSNLPALFIGTLALITFILFFVDSRNSLKEKLVNLGIALIFIVSFMYTRPYLLWHGGQNPVSFPYRFVFIVVFWMLLLAAKELSNLPKKKNSILITGLIVLLLALFASFIRYKFDLLSKATWIALILIPLFILLLLYSRNRRIRIILLGIATIEIVVSGYYELESMGVRVGNTYSYAWC